MSRARDDDDYEDSEMGRRSPLIDKSEPDFMLRWMLGIMGTAIVALLVAICQAQYSGNRELGEIRAEFSATVRAMDQRISSLERRVWGER